MKKKLIFVGVILLVLFLFWFFDLFRYFHLDNIIKHQQLLKDFVADYYLASAGAFILIYILVVAFSLPFATLLSILSGLLFGAYWGTAYAVLGASLGASLFVIGTRFLFDDLLDRHKGDWLKKLQASFEKNVFFAVLSLRLIPVIPFFMVNVAAAILKAPILQYSLATLLGILPGGFVYVSLGAGLGQLTRGFVENELKSALSPELITGLIGLAILSLLPIIYRYFKTKS